MSFFCNLVLCCIVRELETHESQKILSEVSSLDSLPDDLKSKLGDLCLLAYEGVMQNKIVFYHKDLQDFHLPSNLPSMGLLQAVEGLTLLSKSLSYNFLHLSVQELLAAYHISHIVPSKQIEVFKHMFGDTRFQGVLHYYSGFTKLANPAIQDFIFVYSHQQSSITDLLPLLHCFYEAQEPSLCSLVKFQSTRHLDSQLNPVDYSAIGYYISSLMSVSSSAASTVCLKIKSLENHRLKLLLLELSKYTCTSACAASLRMKFSELTVEGARLIASLLVKSVILSELTIQQYNIDSGVLMYLAEALQEPNCHLSRLQISYPVHVMLRHWYNNYELSDCLAFKEMCKINKSLTHLSLSGRRGFACYVFVGLQHNNTLVYLNLSSTLLVATDDTAQALTAMLRVNKTLKHLDLSFNWIFSDAGAYCVCQGLQHNTTLVYLNLNTTGITDKGAEYIVRALDSNHSLQSLDISRNPIRDGRHIAQLLERNNPLKKLVVLYKFTIIIQIFST